MGELRSYFGSRTDSGDTTPCVKSRRSSYTGLYPQVVSPDGETERAEEGRLAEQVGRWGVVAGWRAGS